MRKQLAVLLSCLVFATSCGKASFDDRKSAAAPPPAATAGSALQAPADKVDEPAARDQSEENLLRHQVQRMVITNGTLAVQVDDYEAARAAVDAVVRKYGGHLGSADVARDAQ